VLQKLTKNFDQQFTFEHQNHDDFVHGDTSKRFRIAFEDIFLTKEEEINRYQQNDIREEETDDD
jgi:hypothetical protein